MPKHEFSQQDLACIKAHKADSSDIANILARLQSPARFVPVLRAAGETDGLRFLGDQDLDKLAAEHSQLADIPVKFTPMSGAASRMFAFMQRWLHS